MSGKSATKGRGRPASKRAAPALDPEDPQNWTAKVLREKIVDIGIAPPRGLSNRMLCQLYTDNRSRVLVNRAPPAPRTTTTTTMTNDTNPVQAQSPPEHVLSNPVVSSNNISSDADEISYLRRTVEELTRQASNIPDGPHSRPPGDTHSGFLRSHVVLRKIVDSLWKGSISSSTQRSYRTGMSCFTRFAAMLCLPVAGSLYHHLPSISEEILIFFVAFCFGILKLKYGTIKLYLSGIRFFYLEAGNPNPLANINGIPLLRLHLILKAVKKRQASPCSQRQPITADILRRICSSLKRGFFGIYADSLMLAACTLAFAGFLRSGEFCITNLSSDLDKCLLMQDIIWAQDLESCTLILKASKTDPFRQGVRIPIFKNNTSICPVNSLRTYYLCRLHQGAAPSDPLFVTPDGSILSRTFFLKYLKSILTHLNLDHQFFGGHSFRRGAASSAAMANVEDHLIRTLGRWSSSCYLRYIDTSLPAIRDAQSKMSRS